MILVKFAKALLHFAIVLGILKLFSANGFDLGSYGRLANIHGKIFIFGFFGTLLSFEKLTSQYKYISPVCRLAPFSFIGGAIMLVISAFVKGEGINLYFLYGAHLLFSTGGLLMFIYYFNNIFIHKVFAPSGFLFLLGCATLPVGAIYSIKYRTLLEAPKPEFFLLFPILVIIGERIDFIRIFTRTVLLKGKVVLGIVVFIVYVVSLFVENTYKIEKYLLFSLLSISLVSELIALKHPFQSFKKIHTYMRTTLIISYIFGISGAMLLIAGRFEPGFHSLSLGFVFGMVFSHAIVIFPSIIAKKLPADNQISYLPFLFFTLANLIRVISASAIYMNIKFLSSISFFSMLYIFSGFLHFFSILQLFIMVKKIIKESYN